MLNRITLHGRLARDPELRTTQGGVSVASFTVAVDRDFTDQSGDRGVDFIDCVAWRQGAEFVTKYFRKGNMIVVDGRLQSRKWEDRDGNKRTSWEVITDHTYFGSAKSDESRKDGVYQAPQPQTRAPVDVYRPQGFDGFREMSPGTGAGNPFTQRNAQQSVFQQMDDDDDGELPF